MIKTKTITALVVDCSDLGRGEWNVCVIPNDYWTKRMGKPSYDFYLRHPLYSAIEMFTTTADTPEAAVELAYYNAPDYIPDDLEDCDDAKD